MPIHRNDIADLKNAARIAIRELHAKMGRPPTQNEYKSHAQTNDLPTLHQVLYQYGNWSSAIEDAGFEPNKNTPPPQQPYTVAQLTEEFIRVANQIQKIPGQTEFGASSKFSVRPYRLRWGTWTQVKSYFTEKHADSFEFSVAPPRNPSSQKTIRKPLCFDSVLKFEPQNEMETIILFSLMADRLEYRIRSVRADFPDAELERNGEIILAEFEYESSNYIQHGHDLDADCICICWRNNRDLQSIPVVALEDVLREWRDNQAMNGSRR
ncbi:homing endonuclease associated repeat-containing protein [Stratiformator vulcanicus]|uniref:Uncharacterized protein n=1 Tax=Stratiformator vulcanicus TaxID=2527980 RepID=A0A517QVU4_9PLAN|nr:hypothetical protein [Stratiformator vulcanicus]QDT35738.1 hypothetical protein Pan189_00910 [Stratiformator vulcanicus]